MNCSVVVVCSEKIEYNEIDSSKCPEGSISTGFKELEGTNNMNIGIWYSHNIIILLLLHLKYLYIINL